MLVFVLKTDTTRCLDMMLLSRDKLEVSRDKMLLLPRDVLLLLPRVVALPLPSRDGEQLSADSLALTRRPPPPTSLVVFNSLAENGC